MYASGALSLIESIGRSVVTPVCEADSLIGSPAACINGAGVFSGHANV